MNMDVQFLGYGVFIAVIIGLIMGFPSWQIRLVEAIIVVASGVLTEHEATATISWWSGLHLWAICWPPRCLGRSLYEAEDILASAPPDGPGPSLPLPTGSSGRHTPPSPWIPWTKAGATRYWRPSIPRHSSRRRRMCSAYSSAANSVLNSGHL